LIKGDETKNNDYKKWKKKQHAVDLAHPVGIASRWWQSNHVTWQTVMR
jgi:hypothetical protein